MEELSVELASSVDTAVNRGYFEVSVTIVPEVVTKAWDE